MAVISASSRAIVLPRGASVFFQRRVAELIGLGLMILAAGFFLSYLSYSPTDPSPLTASGATTQNLLGAVGAAVSDIGVKTLGISHLLLLFLLLMAGWRAFNHRSYGQVWLRLAILPISLISGSIAAGALSPKLGGMIGSMTLRRGLALGPFFGGISIGSIGIVAAILCLMTSAYVLGFRIPAIGLQRLTKIKLLPGREPSTKAAHKALPPAKSARLSPKLGDIKLSNSGNAATRTAKTRSRSPLIPAAPSRQKTQQRNDRQGVLPLDPAGYQSPSLRLLAEPPSDHAAQASEAELAQNARALESVLDDFGIRGEIVKIRPGPVVTLYELEPAPGTKSARVIGLADDIARSMSAVAVRIAVVPGRSVIGIELPNQTRETVYLRELMETDAYCQNAGKLALVLGKDIGGGPMIVDLARMPHLLIAGTTGSGKSVGINTMILSLLYRLSPAECRFIMIDPKMLELSVYDGIPHLLSPVVTEPKKAVVALKWAVREMETRYRAMSKLGVRNLEAFNQRVTEMTKNGAAPSQEIQVGFDENSGQPLFESQKIDLKPLHHIVVIVDEMADLMLIAGKDIEAAIQRLAQMARAAGIHLIMATQRPSVDVITGTIKANFPTRVSFQVTSKIDSRTILSESGAEQLLGQGDMLYMAGGGRITRVHGPFVSDREVEAVVSHLKTQGQPDYIEAVTEDPEEGGGSGFGDENGEGSGDALFDQAVALIAREQKASTSFIQRHLQIGYNRAARIIERMENEGMVGAANHVGKREVLLPGARD